MWNAGTILCGSVWLVLCAKRFLSPNRCSCTMRICSSFSIATTANGPSCSCDPLPENIPLRLRADGLYTIERVPVRLRDQHLSTARRYGVPAQEYRKLTFDKTLQQRDEHLDATLLSQGHAALFVDPHVTESYQVHFFEVQIVSEEPLTETKHSSTGEARTQVLYAHEMRNEIDLWSSTHRWN